MPETAKSREELSREHLRIARKLLGLTQQDVGNAMGSDAGTYGAYERRTLVTSDALIRLRGILRQTTDYLLGFDDPCGLTPKERLLLERFRGAKHEDLQDNVLEYARLQEELARGRHSARATGPRPATGGGTRRQ